MQQFTRAVGPAVPNSTSILETFKLFFTAAWLRLLVEQTNRYAVEVLGERASSWEDVTDSEILAFLGFAILVGINQLPALAHYWRRDPIFHYAPIAERISRDRFTDIWRFLHLVDNSAMPDRSDPAYDRLFKVRPVITAIHNASRSNYRASQHHAIDEAMIAFKGRSCMKQYMPKKPIHSPGTLWAGKTACTWTIFSPAYNCI